MNYKMTGRFLSMTLLIEAGFMIPAAIISLCRGETTALVAFLESISITLAVAGLLGLLSRGAPKLFGARDGLVCVSLSWIVMSLLGCLPFFLSDAIPNYIDALFEIVSGFTTTGSSVVADVESLPKGILYWRSFSNWLGGMGVLVFLLAVAPGDGQGKGFTMHLLRAESPGPSVGKLVPKMRKTAAILYVLYIILTVADLIFLLCGGMDVLDAVCTAFSTAGTGGFGIKNDSMASFSPYIQNVTTVFLLLFGINFSCYYLLLLRQFKNVFKDEELRLYIGIVVVSIVLIVLNLRGVYATLADTIRHAAFQVASIISTAGFATTDFDLWPSFSKAVLFGLMLTGACAGSTAGGIKIARVLLLGKGLRRNIGKVLRPNRVQAVRNNGSVVDEQILDNTNAYLAAYALILLLSFVVVSLDNFSLETNISAVVTCFNNVGPGFAAVGPTCNFGGYSNLSTVVLTLDMLLGRLEIFPILVLLSGSTWKRR